MLKYTFDNLKYSIGYWFIYFLKWFFCKINQPILSPSLGGVCAHCHESHLTKRALDGAKAPRKSRRSAGLPRK